MIRRYDYEELRDRAMQTNAPEDLEALASWFGLYDAQAWNGECYKLEDGYNLYPISEPTEYDEDGDPVEFKTVGYGIR